MSVKIEIFGWENHFPYLLYPFSCNYALVIQWVWETQWPRAFTLFVLHSSMDRMIWRANRCPALASYFHFDNGYKLKFIGKLFPSSVQYLCITFILK